MPQIIVTKILPSVHKGDLAIAIAMLTRLKDLRPEWELTLLCRDPHQDQAIFEKYGTVAGELFAKQATRPSLMNVGLRLLRYLLWRTSGIPCLDTAGQDFVKACSTAKALVFCGGGSPGGYGLNNLILHALMPILLAKQQGIKVIFAGIGIEPISGSLHKIIMRSVLNQADLILLRDPLSIDRAGLMGVCSPTELTADWALSLPTTAANEIALLLNKENFTPIDKGYIGINLRDIGALGPEGQTRKQTGYSELMLEMISLLLSQTDHDIVVVSMTRSKKTDDLAFAKSIRDDLPEAQQNRLLVLEDDYSPETIKAIIAAMDIFIATRLHPAIFAVSEAIPTLTIHNFAKVRGFMTLCGLQDWFLDINQVNAADIVVKAKQLLAEKQDISRQIKSRLPALLQAVDKNVMLIEKAFTDS